MRPKLHRALMMIVIKPELLLIIIEFHLISAQYLVPTNFQTGSLTYLMYTKVIKVRKIQAMTISLENRLLSSMN